LWTPWMVGDGGDGGPGEAGRVPGNCVATEREGLLVRMDSK
jgi:hypothetical protein